MKQSNLKDSEISPGMALPLGASATGVSSNTASTSATPSTLGLNEVTANSNSAVVPGNPDGSNTDVQKLQEQLNDIKEQVFLALDLAEYQCTLRVVLCFLDHVPGLFGSFEEYDLPVWAWHLSNVWGSNVGMSNLSENGGKTNPTLLDAFPLTDIPCTY